ncbi:major royal jelly protein 3 [Onthophagus taurus]|uniref:major royal jelly protein 3 n=1 Tax=Onthophagus taurus TaxID=166361 RepID=UPI000C203057|nr:major royal jelly protein 3 [Onthophagus taurus]
MLPKLILLITFGIIACNAYSDKEVSYRPLEWTGGLFQWPCEATKAIYKKSGRYIGKNVIATRGQIYKDEAILALPRYKPGVPVTLAKVSLNQQGCESVLTPFPCWSAQDENSQDGLISVVDLFIDAQEILWILDVGVANSLEQPIRHSKPKVVAYDMKTGKMLKTLDLSGLVVQASRLQYIAVEYCGEGKPYVYVSDAATRSILVFDIVLNKGYRVALPKAILTGTSRRDVLYMALVQKGCGNNFLIFTYLSSTRVFSLRTDYLRAGSAAGKVTDLGPKPHKLVIVGTDLGSAIFFRYEGRPEIYRWDVNTTFSTENFVVVYKSQSCMLATSAFADIKRQRIRVLESNFPDFIQNTVGCGAVQQVNIIGQ